VNEQMQQFARDQIKDGLSKCTSGERNLFKRMYSHQDLDATIEDAVDAMDEDKLDWAMQQISRTLAKKG